MKQDVSLRKIAFRGGSYEIVIPPNLLRELNIRKKNNQLIDQQGELAWLAMWLNHDWDIELTDGFSNLHNINGIIMYRHLHIRGGSSAIRIPHEIHATLDTMWQGNLTLFSLYCNKKNNIVIHPVRAKIKAKNIHHNLFRERTDFKATPVLKPKYQHIWKQHS